MMIYHKNRNRSSQEKFWRAQWKHHCTDLFARTRPQVLTLPSEGEIKASSLPRHFSTPWKYFLFQLRVPSGTTYFSLGEETLHSSCRFPNRILCCLLLILHRTCSWTLCVCVCVSVKELSSSQEVFTEHKERITKWPWTDFEWIIIYSLDRTETQAEDWKGGAAALCAVSWCWVSQAASGGWQRNNLSTVLHNNWCNIAVLICNSFNTWNYLSLTDIMLTILYEWE